MRVFSRRRDSPAPGTAVGIANLSAPQLGVRGLHEGAKKVPNTTAAMLQKVNHQHRFTYGEQSGVDHLAILKLRRVAQEGGTLLEALQEVQEA